MIYEEMSAVFAHYMTQEQLAELTELSANYVSRLETG